ncbi:MAG: 2'-5' RNA ligase family protein [Acidobacteriia bacterium]|nr:2'-5' RNA ligase family protein [Terriglobia bacterium]
MYKDPVPRDRINSFALVGYIPEPLAGFLDRLRQELVPNCFLRAHVTILPPRPVSTKPEEAWSTIRRLVPRFEPFEVQLNQVEVFPVSDVIYVGIGAGSEELKAVHDALDIDGLRFPEAFAYQPHVTLAQELQPDELDELVAVARARWAEFAFAKKFRVEKAVFVQNTRCNEWVDLGECTLGQWDSKLVGELTDILAG